MPEVANIMIAWNVTTLIVGFFCLRCIFGATTPDILWKKYASDTEAVCNDNSRATFYIGPQSSNKWIVFFESGGFCASFEECNKRYLNENSTVLMTSTLLPDKVAGRDLLSASKSENPTFYDYTHVLVPYCSSDLWLGLKTNPQKPFHFVNDSSVDNFSFRGHTIFRSVFQDLLQRYNLSKAEEIVLSGSSAGGIGVLNHADWVLNHVIISRGLNATLKSIVDSGWFIDFQDTLEARINPRFTSLANISLVACQDKSLGYTCCPSASCMIARGYYPASVPLLLISSMYDIFILEDLFGKLEEKGKSENDKTADYVTLVNMYGGAMNESLTTSESEASNLSVFVPACFQHIYLSTSSLWGEEGVFPPSAEFGLGTGKLSHKIQSGTWESTKIQTEVNSSSIKDFITTWVRSRGSPMSMIDSCLGAQCNPTCPAKLLFVDPGAIWKQAVQTIILVLSLVITVVSFGLEATFLLYHYYLKWKQRQFLNEGEDSLLEKELPPCRTRERISIACLSLNYSIDVKKQKTIKEKALPEEKPTKRNNATEIRSGRFSAILEEEEDASSDSQCSGEDPGSLPADNLGFDATAEEGLVTTPHYGLGYSPTLTTTKNNLQLERKIGAGSTEVAIDFSNGKEMGEYLLKEKPPEVDSEKMEETTLREKKILQDVSAYFNPGELIAIMGPSGCGKTTLLDLLTGRRRHGHSKGQVYINGVGLERVQDWYARKIGYVLQLAVPYYEELTVRQNLFFAAHMRLPKKMSHSRKFERVEQILAETGLTSMADAVVGGSMGGGLSGGQKRRLCVALQMINLPSVLFLDEPTSGLDASSSLELLNHLHVVAESGRLVILTIHQPRLEIFHLFHKILLLCDGQVAYYGEPVKAPAVFLKAYIQSTTEAFRQSEDAPKIDAKNPADTIMDILNFNEARRAILDFYQASGEPQAVQEAIMTAKKQDTNNATMAVARMKEKRTDGGTFNRTFVLEARTSERQTLGQMTYFPFVFFMYGVVTGTVYFGAGEKDGILVMAAYCVYCCSSPLFLSSVLMAHLNKALDIFHLERADGCGRSHENVIQTYVRTVAVCLLPVIVCSAMTYFTVNTSHDLWKFFLVTVISLVLNQTWIAVYMMVICAYPRIAHRVCPMVSAIAGFAGGFLVPKPAMPVGYNLLFYINPQFYGYGAITKVLLKDGRLNCAYDSTLNCISTDGNAVLARFGFDKVNIYENLAIMLGMTALSLILAWLFLEMKYINMNCLSRKSTFSKEDEKLSHDKTHSAGIHTARRKSTLQIITEDEGLHTVKLHGHHSADDKWEQRRKLSSRKERWHSTRKRTEHRKSSITAVIEAELEKVSKTAGVIAKTLHHHHHHNHNHHHQVKPQGHNSIMPKTSNNGPHTLDIKNQQQGLSRPRSITDPISNMTQVDELKEPRPRRISEGSASRVRFQDVLEESDRLDDSFFEQSDTCKDLPHNVNIKNQQQGMSRVRSITDPIPNITRADELEESRPRHLSEGSQPRVRFQDVLESDCLDGDSVFEQSETCKGREQWDLQDKKEREGHKGLANNTNKDSEGDVAFCCVEMVEVATEEHETRF